MSLSSSRARSSLLLLFLVPLVAAASMACRPSDAEEGSSLRLPVGVSPMRFATGRVTLSNAARRVEVDVEIAETAEQRSRGLMYRTRLAENAGMIFLFGGLTDGGFWMKNTLIPLSVAFFDERGVINEILDMEPCTADPCHTYAPRSAYVGALEVNKGFFAKADIGVGWSVRLDRDGN